MSVIARQGKKLSLSEKFSRLASRLRDPEWRRYGGLLLGGKAMGIGVVFFITVIPVFSLVTYVQTAAPEVKASDGQSRQHGLTLIAAFLVFDAGRLHDAELASPFA
jgi:hypothetical protein